MKRKGLLSGLAGEKNMTTRKQIRFCVILGLLALVGTGLVGSWITWGREAWMRLEFWLCVLALAA